MFDTLKWRLGLPDKINSYKSKRPAIEAQVLTGCAIFNVVIIPKIGLHPSDTSFLRRNHLHIVYKNFL